MVNFYNKKKSFNVFLLTFFFIFLSFIFFSQKIMACNITILPSSGQYNVGDEIILKIERIQTCGRCVLPLDQTKFNIENAKIVEIGSWTKEGIKDVINIKMKFTEAGEVKFEVIRACTKNYNVARAIFTVVSLVSTSNYTSNSTFSNNYNSLGNEDKTDLNTSNSSNDKEVVDEKKIDLNTSNVNDLQGNYDSKIEGNYEENEENLKNNIVENNEANLEENITQKNIDSLNQSNKNSLLDFIKSNLSYILIAFFLIVGFVSYILKLKFLRNIILLFSLIFLGFYLGGCPCIVGSTFNIFNLKNANIIYFILLSLIPILTSFIWGRWFCGWFCPIGAFQKFIYSIKPKNPDNLINKAIIKINGFLKKNDKLLKYLKIFIFIIFGYLYISKGYNLFCHYEPFKVIFAFNGSLINISIAFFIFLFASFNERLFCKYLCPLAGILKFTSKLSIKKVKVDSKLCTECKICTKDLCPTDAIKCDEKNNKIIIDNGECIRCLKCEDLCRTKSLSLK